MKIVNVVGGGKLGREVDLESLYEDIGTNTIEYDPEKFPGMIFRLDDPEATVMLFTSGKYSLAGAKSHNAAKEANQYFLSTVEPFLGNHTDTGFEIRYVVCTLDLGMELNLNRVVLTLGTNKTEYEPEQFPGVFYRPEGEDWFAIIFNSGKVVINGGPELDILERACKHLKESLSIQI